MSKSCGLEFRDSAVVQGDDGDAGAAQVLLREPLAVRGGDRAREEEDR